MIDQKQQSPVDQANKFQRVYSDIVLPAYAEVSAVRKGDMAMDLSPRLHSLEQTSARVHSTI